MINFKQGNRRKRAAGFTLAEVVVAIAIFAFSVTGVIYGYIQVNYRAQRSSMSLAAESLAAQSVEQAMAAKWDIHAQSPGTGPGTSDELPPTNYVQVFTNAMLVPGTGESETVTNYVSISTAYDNPPVREVRADCAWRAPLTERWVSNTVITYRVSNL
ncbi:MAG TPA: type II secretion system protein [Verrucomicrobiae bacterium]|nr:type II secretion system protein [Verrucomicrobiae bacterium]